MNSTRHGENKTKKNIQSPNSIQFDDDDETCTGKKSFVDSFIIIIIIVDDRNE